MFKYVAAAKILKKHKASVDNAVFHLHYRITFLVFIVSSGLVTAKEFVGSPINCLANGIKGNVLNTYCYIMSTFSVPKHWNTPLKGNPALGHYSHDGIAYPGVGPYHPQNDDVVYHAYYQWVPFVLFLQALMFYIPRYLWKNIEGGLFRTILGGLENIELDKNKREKKHKVLVNYMMSHLNMHRNWAIRFFLCELLCFINVIGNIYFIDHFLGGTFLNYGIDVINLPDQDPETRVDPMVKIFPRLAKCTFRKFGSSGTLEVADTMCVLAVNIINEKIYIFIWFWLISLAAITAVWLVYRAAIILVPSLRKQLIQFRGRWAGEKNLDIVTRKCNLGDWFLLYHLGRSMDPMVYGEFLKEFGRELENSAPTLERKPILSHN